jgi:hypothetical protein
MLFDYILPTIMKNMYQISTTYVHNRDIWSL